MHRKGIALIPVLILLAALPIMVLTVLKGGFDVRKRAADDTTVCKTGINSFSVDTPCGTDLYRYMSFECYDGFGRHEGGTTSCKSSAVWASYAKEYCTGRSNCTPSPVVSSPQASLPGTTTRTPTPTPTPYKSPTPYPTPTPVPTAIYSTAPKPTITPTPYVKPSPYPTAAIPTPVANSRPVITTYMLPYARRNVSFSVFIYGRDSDLGDILTMNISNLPSGVFNGPCSSRRSTSINEISCNIFGKVLRSGFFSLNVVLKDNHGNSTQRSVYLIVY